ncbi:MAG: serine/threonine-protein kinase [Calothrix sp. MO_192.B10]|nr:serine/threonine-protein kinase [Calothrix sp. MO_192.B10]
MTNYMIGKVLQKRYQVVQTLGAGVFGQTFIAIDIEQPNNPKCVIKQLKVFSYQSNYLENLRLRFLSETQTLSNLGQHQQIPQLLSCFEENERFYLVQELIEGNPLTGELPINSNMGSIYLWTENEVVRFLQDILSVLDFIHSQGVIHCDIKPDNLIRRAYDGRLFLIDFGSIQPVDFGTDVVLPIYQMPVTSLGYIPPEQFIGQTKPNSDIYALGIIAIQALTGLTPLNFQVDPYSNEIIWRSHYTPVGDYLAAILSQMIRYDYTHRFQSAAQVLNAVQDMPLEQWEPKNTIHTDYIVLPESTEDIRFPPEDYNDSSSSNKPVKSSSLLTGMKVGLVANSIFLGFGAYSLINNYPAYSGTETLYNAAEKYQSGDLEQAISLAKSIPSNSDIYPDAQARVEEWQAQWQIAAEKFSLVTQAFNNAQWSDVLRVAPEVPNILYWRSKTDKLVERAKNNIETQTQDLLNQAYTKARDRDFTMALHYLKQIPGESLVGALVKEKITEYEQKQRTRAVYLLQQAYNQAATSDFDNAIKSLKQIPKNTPSYKTAQLKLREYIHKQRIQASAKNTRLSSSKSQVLLDNSSVNGQQVKFNSSLKNVSHTSLENLPPEKNHQEMNIQ